MIFLNKNMGKRIKQLRVSSKMSQEVTAKKAGLSRPHYTNIENGRVIPENETLYKILSAFDFKPSEARNTIAQWHIEDALENADNPGQVIQNVKNGNIINGGNIGSINQTFN